MSKARNGSHGRVEHARQALVNAEEAYLRANGWALQCYVGVWLWRRNASATSLEFVAMQRTEAVKFQHTQLEGLR